MRKLAALLAGAMLMMATSAMALTYAPSLTPQSSQLQGVLDSITTSPIGNSSVNVNTDMIADPFDSYWNITASGGSVATMVIELGSYAPNNKLFVYDSTNIANSVKLFDGTNVQGDQVTLSLMLNGDVKVNGVVQGHFNSNTFGYMLDSSFYTGGGKFYSDTKLNETINGEFVNHMLAYQGTGDTIQIPGYYPGEWTNNEYILAFEDLYGTGSDFNFTDMVVMVESVNPVPEPGTMVLLGAGLLGLAVFGKRRMNKEA